MVIGECTCCEKYTCRRCTFFNSFFFLFLANRIYISIAIAKYIVYCNKRRGKCYVQVDFGLCLGWGGFFFVFSLYLLGISIFHCTIHNLQQYLKTNRKSMYDVSLGKHFSLSLSSLCKLCALFQLHFIIEIYVFLNK